MMNRSRPVFNSINDIKAWMSTKTRVPSHYETLKVTQSSTQDDIKSSYYELSKMYHPDRNTSADAKKKFQDLSVAYEVLGNFSKRKQYDRDLTARGTNATQKPVYAAEEDPMAGFYRSRKSNYNPSTSSATREEAQFDFDEWTRSHYGRSLQRSLEDKEKKKRREEILKEYKQELEREKSSALFSLALAIVLMTALIIQNVFATNFDKNTIKNKSEKEDKKS